MDGRVLFIHGRLGILVFQGLGQDKNGVLDTNSQTGLTVGRNGIASLTVGGSGALSVI